MSREKFTIYRDSADEWRWNLRAGNGRVIATGAESYRNRGDCLAGIELVRIAARNPLVPILAPRKAKATAPVEAEP